MNFHAEAIVGEIKDVMFYTEQYRCISILCHQITETPKLNSRLPYHPGGRVCILWRHETSRPGQAIVRQCNRAGRTTQTQVSQEDGTLFASADSQNIHPGRVLLQALTVQRKIQKKFNKNYLLLTQLHLSAPRIKLQIPPLSFQRPKERTLLLGQECKLCLQCI